MNFLPYLKPALCVTIVAGTAITAVTLTVINSKAKSKDTGDVDLQPKPQDLSKNNFAIFIEGTEPTNPEPQEGKQRVKCKLEGVEKLEYCSLSKVVETGNKNLKRIDLNTFKKLAVNTHIEPNFFIEDKGLYKVRASGAFIEDWQQDTTKALHIYPDIDSVDSDTKPLKTLTPKTAIKQGDVFRGMLEYMYVRVKEFTRQAYWDNSFETLGKSFTCDYPGGQEEYKNCEFLEFYAPHTVSQSIRTVAINKTFENSQTIATSKHCLIKLNEPINITDTSLDKKGQDMKVKVYSDPNRQTLETTGVIDITVTYSSPVVVINDGDSIDFAIVF